MEELKTMLTYKNELRNFTLQYSKFYIAQKFKNVAYMRSLVGPTISTILSGDDDGSLERQTWKTSARTINDLQRSPPLGAVFEMCPCTLD